MSDVRDWVVTYKSSVRAPVEVWAVIVGVPAELEAGAVSTALELWERWPVWQARTRPGSTINVRRWTKRDEEPAALAHRLAWSTLAPRERRVQVSLPGPLYAACRRAARVNGQSLASWVIYTLGQAAVEYVGDVDEAPLFVDVPLPLGGGE